MIVNRSMETLDRGRLPAARCDSNVTLSNDRQTYGGEAFSLSVETVASVIVSASRDTQSVSPDDAKASFVVHRASFSDHFVARPGADASSSLTTVAVALHDAAGNDSDDSVWFQRVAGNHPEVAFSSLRFAICTAIASNCHERNSRWPIPSSRTPLRRPRTLPVPPLATVSQAITDLQAAETSESIARRRSIPLPHEAGSWLPWTRSHNRETITRLRRGRDLGGREREGWGSHAVTGTLPP
jgi:hypothetical protein